MRLERALIAAAEASGRVDWSNQVPVASGVAKSSSERRRAIDLVQELSVDHFAFIELKVASDTPLYAAMEIIAYGCAWLLSRKDATDGASALLTATTIDLVVLAPAAYYAPFPLQRLQRQLDCEVHALGEAHGVSLSLRYEVLPEAVLEASCSAPERLPALFEIRSRLPV